MIHWATLGVGEQIGLTDIGKVGRIIVFGEQVVKRLIAARANGFGDRFIPFVGIGEYRVDIEHHPAKGEQPVANHIADAEVGAGFTRGNNFSSRLT